LKELEKKMKQIKNPSSFVKEEISTERELSSNRSMQEKQGKKSVPVIKKS